MDEAALILEAQRGDLDSFNRLVLAYQTQVYNLAYRIFGDANSAADAAQEAFLAAYRGLKAFRGGSFRSWLLRIVTNICYDELRRRKRRPAASLEAILESEVDLEDDGAGLRTSGPLRPEAAMEQAELSKAIQDCLNRLPDDFRVVVILADVQGYDYAEISAVAALPLGTVKSRLARARLRLRDCLQRFRELLPAAFRLEDEAAP
ncbi:MAG TPA: sigma-70 family RNA polymerase sigma factor [Anaerolineales bacterium]|nr:sigma-70 family RNA polymerase sigma factor [Anaerolineales bacterium]